MSEKEKPTDVQFAAVMMQIHAHQASGWAQALKDNVKGEERFRLNAGLNNLNICAKQMEERLGDNADEIYVMGETISNLLKQFYTEPKKAYLCLELIKEFLAGNIEFDPYKEQA